MRSSELLIIVIILFFFTIMMHDDPFSNVYFVGEKKTIEQELEKPKYNIESNVNSKEDKGFITTYKYNPELNRFVGYSPPFYFYILLIISVLMTIIYLLPFILMSEYYYNYKLLIIILILWYLTKLSF